MSRLIDADVLKGKITSVGIVDAYGDYYGAADVVFAKDIDATPTVNAGWISVKDQLPDKSGEYLVYRAEFDLYGILQYSRQYELWNVFDSMKREHAEQNTIHGVTHWMPLPISPTAQSCE